MAEAPKAEKGTVSGIRTRPSLTHGQADHYRLPTCGVVRRDHAHTITDLAKRDIIVRAGAGYALTASVCGYCDHLRKLATGRGGDEAIASATAERARLAREQANLAETKATNLRGDLVEAAAVGAEWGEPVGGDVADRGAVAASDGA